MKVMSENFAVQLARIDLISESGKALCDTLVFGGEIIEGRNQKGARAASWIDNS
jgi:hypothetical protein